MPKFACPICGDPNAFPLWIDDEPPHGCPEDVAAMNGDAPQIRSVVECPYQMAKAKQAAELRKVAPDCFDKSGNMKPNRSGDAWRAWVASNSAKKVTV